MAGAGYKLFNTGDVLTAAQVNTYLMEQSVMVFADAAARTTALTGVVAEGMLSYLKDTNAVEVYNGSAWVASDDPNAIQNTIVDAKGDLITATGSDVPARLAVGNNGDTLLADSSATTGLRWSAQPAASNPVVNGGMDVWQRGTSFASSNFLYTADRWQIYTGASTNSTISRQATGDTTNLPFIQYCVRYQRNSGVSGTAQQFLAQSFESVNSIPYAGKTVTLSFYARKGADYSAASSILTVNLNSGTGTDQNIVSGFTGSDAVLTQNATLTTTWQRFQFTGTVVAARTQLGVQFYWTPVGTASTNDYFEVTGVQLDVGNVALPFRRSGGTLQGELAAAQRYYQRFTCGGAAGRLAMGMNDATTTSALMMNLPVTMRSTPPTLDFGNVQITEPGNNNFALTGLTVSSLSTNTQMHLAATGLTGLTLYRPCYLTGTGSTSYIAFSAEL